ncbi:MAG: hypothetical protein RR374_05310 [Clostridia bacterium]
MLSKQDKALMKVVYYEAEKNNGSCLIKPIDLLKGMSYKVDFPRYELASRIKSLATEDYYELIETEKQGELVYCCILHPKGKAFARELESEKRAIKMKIILTSCGVIASFVLGRILAWIVQLITK